MDPCVAEITFGVQPRPLPLSLRKLPTKTSPAFEHEITNVDLSCLDDIIGPRALEKMYRNPIWKNGRVETSNDQHCLEEYIDKVRSVFVKVVPFMKVVR